MMKVWFSSPSLLPSVLILDSLFVLGSEEPYICCEHYFARYTNAKYHTCQHRKQTSASSTCRVKPGNISCLSCIIKLFLAYWSGESNRLRLRSHQVTHASHYRADVSVSVWWLLVIIFRETPGRLSATPLTVLLTFLHMHVRISEHLMLTQYIFTADRFAAVS